MKTVTSRLVKLLVFTLLCTATVTTVSAHNQQSCTEWDLDGEWRIVHPNSGGYSPLFTLKVTQGGIQGGASSGYFVEGSLFKPGHWVGFNGSVHGKINGSSLELTVSWEKTNDVYIYTGEINAEGLMQGSAYAKDKPETKADWHSERAAKCLKSTVVPENPSPVVPENPSPVVPENPSPVVPENPSPVVNEYDAAAKKGEVIANQDRLATALRNLQPEGPVRRGFDIGMAAAEGHTADGDGKRRIKATLLPEEQRGFTAAVTFTLARNKNANLVTLGETIALTDKGVANALYADDDPFYQLGFDIGTGLFGDPAKGTVGSTQLGPGSLAIRSELNAAGQRGFDDSVKLHFGRKYR